tara:strand:+ start:209 stop:580 length:372 start_codon:yes stop_codon:yes gene_type:complete
LDFKLAWKGNSLSKNIFVFFADFPFGTNKTSEKLRLLVGLTLNDENVLNLVFLGNSRYALQVLDETKTELKPVYKHLEMLATLDAKFYVEDGVNFSIINNFKYESIQASEVNNLLDKADVVIH